MYLVRSLLLANAAKGDAFGLLIVRPLSIPPLIDRCAVFIGLAFGGPSEPSSKASPISRSMRLSNSGLSATRAICGKCLSCWRLRFAGRGYPAV